MRIRTVLCATALATVSAFPLAGVAAAQQPADLDCRDFASQAAAQSALSSRSGDSERLDPDRDGVACEAHFTPAQVPDGERPAAGRGDGERPAVDRGEGERPAADAGDEAPPVRPVLDRDPESVVDRDRDPESVVDREPGADRDREPVLDRDREPGVDRDREHPRVRTVPEHQILVKPHGAPDTGDGSAADVSSPGSDPASLVLLAGGLGAVGVLGAVGARRRATRP